jgi:hypothetical protein
VRSDRKARIIIRRRGRTDKPCAGVYDALFDLPGATCDNAPVLVAWNRV